MRGVYKSGKKWLVRLNDTHYGCFNTEEEAIEKVKYLVSLNPILANCLFRKKKSKEKKDELLDM